MFSKSLLSDEWRAAIMCAEVDNAFEQLSECLKKAQLQGQKVYPATHQYFRALNTLDPEAVKVVILGQDPYHGVGQANGLAFAVPPDCPEPPSLKNIKKEVIRDLTPSRNGVRRINLNTWSAQGVLLLNTILSVAEGQPGSHRKQGWERITDEVIRWLGARTTPLVFMLWGAAAQKKAALLSSSHHKVLMTSHPSPLSVYRGFSGCGHFSECNRFLIAQGQASIDWFDPEAG